VKPRLSRRCVSLVRHACRSPAPATTAIRRRSPALGRGDDAVAGRGGLSGHQAIHRRGRVAAAVAGPPGVRPLNCI
jgi:hypothetical protein